MSRTYAVFQPNGDLLHRLDSALHQIPDGAVAIDEETWLRLTQETDGTWSMQPDGNLIKKPHPPVLPDHERAMIEERAWRNNMLDSVKWLRERHRDQMDLQQATTLSPEQFAELLAYMQHLRDWPQSNYFPDPLYRPVVLEWMTDPL